ncbi:hypothetical protein ARMGADRAFT_1036057 [Armillaria gallica]|uniref:Uncharacterized protein n=1 Tax=Armillaria gallica TaxID=47427 RepID=A0A2H3CVM6_ARMGA|nr:hypothetical protein ARMGADRAFT_1036057 [Armillaria gallica]
MPNGEVARVVITGDIEGDEWAKIFGKHVSPPEHSDNDCSSDEEEYDDEGEDEEMTAQFQGDQQIGSGPQRHKYVEHGNNAKHWVSSGYCVMREAFQTAERREVVSHVCGCCEKQYFGRKGWVKEPVKIGLLNCTGTALAPDVKVLPASPVLLASTVAQLPPTSGLPTEPVLMGMGVNRGGLKTLARFVTSGRPILGDHIVPMGKRKAVGSGSDGGEVGTSAWVHGRSWCLKLSSIKDYSALDRKRQHSCKSGETDNRKYDFPVNNEDQYRLPE